MDFKDNMQHQPDNADGQKKQGEEIQCVVDFDDIFGRHPARLPVDGYILPDLVPQFTSPSRFFSHKIPHPMCLYFAQKAGPDF